MMQLSQIAAITRGQAFGADVSVDGVSIDSRSVSKNDLFIAIKGENFDGQDFVAAAEKQGAVAALVVEKQLLDMPQVVVEDTTKALGLIAQAWREHFNIPVIAVTGSNGKTTVVAMIASVLNHVANCLAPRESFNNHWGVPLTLLGLNEKHRYAVIEMGMNHAGEIAYLSHITRPTIALINNIAGAHLEGVGSLEAVANAKQEIFQGLDNQGVAVINLDEPFHVGWRQSLGQQSQMTFSMSDAGADVYVENYYSLGERSRYTLVTAKERCDVLLPISGKHNVNNALAAAACCLAAGVSLASISEALSTFQPVARRVEWKRTANGATLIDDSFNANPASMQAGLDVLVDGELKTFERRIAVLGKMAELGADAEVLHKQIGAYAQSVGVSEVFCLCDDETQLARHYREGYPNAKVFDSVDTLTDGLLSELSEDVLLLVKGSKSAGMDRVVNALQGGAQC